ncbi:MAG: response regulator [Pseudomonadota bacterium]|nr:response regulator [Pseudomonadota bacterium]
MLAQEEVRVIVVDDAVDTREATAAVLNASGYLTREAADSTTALGLIQQWLPHCVILDIDMPGIDGVELARHIRANYGGTVTLVALSGFDAFHPRVKTISGIVDHAMCKPCDFPELLGILEGLRPVRKLA